MQADTTQPLLNPISFGTAFSFGKDWIFTAAHVVGAYPTDCHLISHLPIPAEEAREPRHSHGDSAAAAASG